MSPDWTSLAMFLLGAACMGLVQWVRHVTRPMTEEESSDTRDPQWTAGYNYGLLIGHERGWRDANRGRVA